MALSARQRELYLAWKEANPNSPILKVFHAACEAHFHALRLAFHADPSPGYSFGTGYDKQYRSNPLVRDSTRLKNRAWRILMPIATAEPEPDPDPEPEP